MTRNYYQCIPYKDVLRAVSTCLYLLYYCKEFFTVFSCLIVRDSIKPDIVL